MRRLRREVVTPPASADPELQAIRRSCIGHLFIILTIGAVLSQLSYRAVTAGCARIDGYTVREQRGLSRIEGYSVQEQSVQEQSVQEQSVQEQSVQEQSVQEQAGEGRSNGLRVLRADNFGCPLEVRAPAFRLIKLPALSIESYTVREQAALSHFRAALAEARRRAEFVGPAGFAVSRQCDRILWGESR
jgi:hypothetical protein